MLLGSAAALLWLLGPSLSAWADRMRLPEVQVLVVRAAAPAAAAAIEGAAANGYVVAARRAALSSDVPGRIVEMLVQEGSVVKRGDVVARLYSDEYAASLQRAQADHEVAKAAMQRADSALLAAQQDERQAAENTAAQRQLLAEAQAQEAFTQREIDRARALLEQGIGSSRDVQRAESEDAMAKARARSLEAALRRADAAVAAAALRVEVGKADVTVAAAQRAAAEAAMKLAAATLEKTNVRAPFDGVVVLKDAEVGEVVSPNVQGGGNARGAVCTMVDFDSLEVQANVPETALQAVQVGAPAAVFLDAFPDRRLPGRVDRIWPTADRQKATVEVRVKLLAKDEGLRPEMGVRIVFGGKERTDTAAPTQPTQRDLLILPENAVLEIQGKPGVFVVERDTARFVELVLGERKGGNVAVEQGLRPGQTIVLTPPPALQDGDRIRIAKS